MSSNELPDSPITKFKKLIADSYYIEAVNFASNIDKLIKKEEFQELLFGKKDSIFLKALKQAVQNKNGFWLQESLPNDNESLKLPAWFTKRRDSNYPKWSYEPCSRLVKAQIICAKEAIHAVLLEPSGWKARKNWFSHWLAL